MDWADMDLPGQLMGTVNTLIVDQTGLTGSFSLRLHWTPDLSAVLYALDRVSLYTALEEQLGLRLEPAQGDIEMLVIDAVSRPTPD